MFDLDQIEKNPPPTYRLVIGMSQDDKPVGFVLKGPDSEEYRAADRKLQIATMREREQRTATLDVAKDADAEVVMDMAESRMLAFAMNCTVDWFGWTRGEAEAPFTPENLMSVLSNRPHLVATINAEVQRLENFM